MLLERYIASIAEDKGRKEGAKKAAMVGKSLQAYFGERWGDADMLEIVLPETISGYSEFLQTAYIPTDSHGNLLDESSLTAQEQEQKKAVRRSNHLTALRAILTQAMVQGILFPSDPFALLGDFKRQQQRKNIPDIQAEIDTLIHSRSKASSGSAAKVYLLCLGLGGIKYEDLIALSSELGGSETIVLHAGGCSLEVKLDTELKGIITEFFDKEPIGQQTFEERIQSLSSLREWTLLAGKNIFYDWLRLAQRIAHLPDGIMFSLVRSYLSKENLSEEAARTYEETSKKVCDFIFNRNEKERPYWVAAFTSWPVTAEMLEDKALTNTLLKESLTGNVYCPCHTRVIKQTNRAGVETTRRAVTDPNRSVLRNILFVRANSATLALFRKEYQDAWIMRRKGADSYVRIPSDQLSKMRSILNAFGYDDDIEVTIEDDVRRSAEFAEREEVILTHPTFQGQIAVVRSIDTKRSTPETKYYKVDFTLGDGKKFSLSILSEHLEKLTAKQL